MSEIFESKEIRLSTVGVVVQSIQFLAKGFAFSVDKGGKEKETCARSALIELGVGSLKRRGWTRGVGSRAAAGVLNAAGARESGPGKTGWSFLVRVSRSSNAASEDDVRGAGCAR